MPERARAILPAHNPDVGFVYCSGRDLSVNICTHTGLGPSLDPRALRDALDELARRAPLTAARLRVHRRWLPGRSLVWEPTATPHIPLVVEERSRGESIASRCAAGTNVVVDPTREPPLRFSALSGPDGVADLVLTTHHALVDGASCGFLFWAIKRLYAARLEGREISSLPLPRIVCPDEREFVACALGENGSKASRTRLAGLRRRGWIEIGREMRFRNVGLPSHAQASGARSLHRTIALDLDGPALSGLGAQLASRDATLNEGLQAAVASGFFRWARLRGVLDRTLPMGTTFDLRKHEPDRYALGNFETAICVELRASEADHPDRLLETLAARSRRHKSSDLPWAHFLALADVARAPSPLLPRIVEGVASRAALLFSYLGSDYSRRYLTRFEGAGAGPLESRLVADHPGTGEGYVTSSPPMGLVVTVKRVGRTVMLNLSLNDRIADVAGLESLAETIRERIETLSGPPVTAASAAPRH